MEKIPKLDSAFEDPNVVHFSTTDIPLSVTCASGWVRAEKIGNQVLLNSEIKAIVYKDGGIGDFIASIGFEFFTLDDLFINRSFGTNLSFNYVNHPYSESVITIDSGNAAPIPAGTGFVWMTIGGEYVAVWRLSDI